MSMSLADQFGASLLLLLAAFLGCLIGLDRERREHEAGMRTHMMVCLGSCLFTILSAHAFPGGDPARIASQILPGMGFLGAGTILKYGKNIRGLTTATSIWATAAIGMAVGGGEWFLAINTTLLVWFILAVLHRIEKRRSVRTKPQGDPAKNHPDNLGSDLGKM
jgi:putative Mg2+ transporter-C (MgtC) family protein